MDEKLTLQELMELLAQKHDMEQEDAEAFVRMFFRLIEEALGTDKYVKVKGLGTFKLIESQVGARISFTPDASMRDLVNKPFAHFETVVLNENTHFDDMSEEENVSMLSAEMDEAFGEEESKSVLDCTVSDDAVSVLESLSENNKEALSATSKPDSPAKSELASQAVLVQSPVSMQDENRTACHTESAAESSSSPKTSHSQPVSDSQETIEKSEASSSVKTEKKKIFRFPWCMLASILLIGVFVGGGMVWNFFSHKRYVSDSVLDSLISQRLSQTILIEQTEKGDKERDTAVVAVVKSPTVSKTVSQQTSVTDKAHVEQSAQQQPVRSQTSQEQSAAQEQAAQKQTVQKPETLSDTVEYQITGTQTTYTLRAGESLVKVAQKFYGNKRLWPYLVKHNSKTIKNANRVPAGATIEIPILSPKK